MCMVCDLRNLSASVNQASAALAEGVESMAQAFMPLMEAIRDAKKRLGTLDSGIETAYARGLEFLRGDDGAATPVPDDVKAKVAEAYSAQTGIPVENIVVCDSPEQAEAVIEKALKGKESKSH